VRTDGPIILLLLGGLDMVTPLFPRPISLLTFEKFANGFIEGNQDEGENLYTRTSHPFTHKPLRHAVDVWIDERRNYQGQRIGRGSSGYGHYTQIIWPETTHVGMASARGRGGRQVIVARYAPGGNVVGRSAYE
jgi:hypothetical protein